VVLVPLAVLIEDKPPTFTSSFVLITIWSAVVPTTIGFYCWARAIDRVPVAKASQILLLAPIVGMLLSAGVLGERLSPALLSSAALILVGAALSYLPAPSGAKST
jgi:drug/metabolite transporter (DMT)-like permease